MISLLCSTLSLACAAPQTTPPGEVRLRVGQPCAALQAVAEPAFVLIELADAQLDLAASALQSALAQPIAVRGVARVLAPIGEPTSMPWGGCTTDACEVTSERTLTVTPHLTSSEHAAVQLTVAFASESTAESAPKAVVVEVRNQEPALLRFDSHTPQPPNAWILTPYLMRDRRDLQLAMSCRLEAEPAQR